MFGNRGGRKPNRVTWTYEGGVEVCLEDKSEMARLFEKMITVLDAKDLTFLAVAIGERRNELLAKVRQALPLANPLPVPVVLALAQLEDDSDVPELDLIPEPAVEVVEPVPAAAPEPGRADNVFCTPQVFTPEDLAPGQPVDRTPEMLAEARCDNRHGNMGLSGRASYCRLIAALVRAADDPRGIHASQNAFLGAQAEYLDTSRGTPDGISSQMIGKEWSDICAGIMI